MCKWGTTEIVSVKIPADLSHTGQEYWKEAAVDFCLAPVVKALQGAGIDMRSSCCGHGKGPGQIVLQNGRTLEVVMPGFRCPNCGGDLSIRMSLLALAIKSDYPDEDYPENIQAEGLCEECGSPFRFSGPMFTEVIITKIRENVIDPRSDDYAILNLDFTEEEIEELRQILEEGNEKELKAFMKRVLKSKD